MGAAFHRAAHQVLEEGSIFRDPLAVRILGPEAEEAVLQARNTPSKARLRLFIAIRSRFAEDAMAAAVQSGATQVVILGAGLDTCAYRSNLGPAVRIFEVDHPATQAWKRVKLEDARISVPSSLTFAPVDFEKGTLAGGLSDAGFDPTRETFFTWLGVVPYLTQEAVISTLRFISGLPAGGHVVFDYGNPPSPEEEAYSAAHQALSSRVARIGESIRSHYESADLHRQLRRSGYRDIEDMGPLRMRERFFPKAPAAASDRGGHIVRASTLISPRSA